MTCSKCKNSGIYNEILGKGFYYCRTCKEEIFLEEDTKDIVIDYAAPRYLTQKEIDDIFTKLNGAP